MGLGVDPVIVAEIIIISEIKKKKIVHIQVLEIPI